MIRRLRLVRREPTLLVAAAVITLSVALFLLAGPTAHQTGLKRSVYTQVGFRGAPRIADISPDISLNFLVDDPLLSNRDFSARWHGFWYLPAAASVDLYGAGDDRLDIWLDGELVIRRNPPADMHTIARTLTLEPGAHEILIEYQQFGGGAALSVEWAPRDGPARPFAPSQLFPERPTAEQAQRSLLHSWLEKLLFVSWIVMVFGGGFLVARKSSAKFRLEWRPTASRYHLPASRAVLVAGVVAIMAAAVTARIAGWNPPSLWIDDIIYGAILRSDVVSMLSVPIHVAPGLFLLWRPLYALLPDPEWSLQVLPFACGILSIPVVAATARLLTRDDGLALLAAVATASNRQLAHYTVFVHQYTFDFLVTALLLLAGAKLSRTRSVDRPAAVTSIAVAGALASFFSAPSVFVSFPLVHLSAFLAVRRRNHERRRKNIGLCVAVAAYDVAVLFAYLFMSNRTNPHVRATFSAGFMPFESPAAFWVFLSTNGRRLLETSLPNVEHPFWPLSFVGLGLVWLLARRRTRLVALMTVGAYAAFALASALRIYPLGTGRPDIFSFPLAILLFAGGVGLATAALPARRFVRMAVSLTLTFLVVLFPLRVEYRSANGKFLIEQIAVLSEAEDGVILTGPSAALAGFYGPWTFTVSADTETDNGTRVTIDREHTLHLTGRHADSLRQTDDVIEEFLTPRPDRVWVLYFHTPRTLDVNGPLEGFGYTLHEVATAPHGRLYLALLSGGGDSTATDGVPSRRPSAQGAL